MFQIREATAEDYHSLMEFFILMNEIINRRTGKYNPENAIFPSGEMVERAIAGRELYVGMDGEAVAVACIASHECDDAYQNVHWQVEAGPDEFLVLHALRVHPDYEGRGFAKQMLRYVIGKAQDKNQKAIRLDVLEGYSVERMYLPLGFQHVDTVEIFYEDIGFPERFKLFEKVLDLNNEQ